MIIGNGRVIAAISLLALAMTFAPAMAASWDIETVDSAGSVGIYPSLALNSAGNPRISYCDSTNLDLKYAAWNGAAWDIQTVDSAGNVGYFTSLALDSAGNPRISYYDSTNLDLKYAAWDGASWDIQTVDSAGNVGYFTSLALDSTGYPRFSYRDYTNNDLKYAAWNSASWDIQTVDSAGNVGWTLSLTLDSSGYPRISYYDSTNDDLKYAAWNDGSWDIQTVDSAGDVGEDSSLALDSSGNPRISYYDITNYDLKYAAWNGASWDIQTVDSAGNVGYFTSLALDSAGNPRISYYDATNDDLKYAAWNGAAWDIQTVASWPGLLVVGEHPSLALDSSGYPRISYYEATNFDLKYAEIPPVIPAFSATPVSGPAPLAVTFTGTISNGPAIARAWSFGDGGTAFLQNPSHTYTTPGTYTVSLTAYDGYGINATTRAGYITVTEVTPVPTSPTATPVYSAPGFSSDSSDSGPPPSAGTVGTVNANVGGNSAVNTVTVTGTGVNEVIVTGQQQGSLPDGVPPADPNAYQYIELTPAQVGTITGATINFEVPVSWLDEQGLTTADVTMTRYIDGEWTTLPTTFNGVTNGIASYTAQSPGFSLFAIAPKKGGAMLAPLEEETCPAVGQQSCPACSCTCPSAGSPPPLLAPVETEETIAPPSGWMPETGFPLVTVALISAGCVLLIGSGWYVRRWWIRRQNPALFRKYN